MAGRRLRAWLRENATVLVAGILGGILSLAIIMLVQNQSDILAFYEVDDRVRYYPITDNTIPDSVPRTAVFNFRRLFLAKRQPHILQIETKGLWSYDLVGRSRLALQ